MHLRGKGRGFEAQQGGCAVRPVNFAAGLGEGIENESALVLLEIVKRRGCGLRRRVGLACWAACDVAGAAEAEVELAVARAYHGAFDDVLQLADVARPIV